MMKRVGFKKYTIFLLVCFFALLLSINAYENGDDESFELDFGATHSIPDQQHINFKCSGALTYFGLTNTGSGYTVTQLIKAPAGNEITEVVSCEWTGSTALGVENNEAGSATFKFIAVTEEETTPNGGGDSETPENPEAPEEPTTTMKYLSLGLDSWDINILTALKAYSITSFVPDDKNVDYISITGCNTAGGESKECFVGVSDLLLQQVEQDGYIGQDYVSTITVKYKKKENGVEHIANVVINIIANGTARIWDNHTSQNRPGTCSYNSGEWRKASYERSNGAKVHFYEAVNVGEELPDCTANANYIVPVEFKGWIVGVEGTTAVSEQMLNNSHIRYFGKCEGAITPGTPSERGMNYAPCYEAAPFVQISIPSGTVQEPGWKMLREGNGYYYTANDPNATITLPDVVFSGYDANSKVRYWYNSADPSKQYDVGKSVPLDGSTYIAVVDSVIQTINNYKTIHLNDTVVFSVEGMKSCSLGQNNASTYLDVADQNSDCRVTGKALTGDLFGEQLPTVTVEFDGFTREYYFTVLTSVGEDSGGDDGFIIDTESNTEAGSDGANSTDYFSKVCPDFRIKGSSNSNSKDFGISAVNGSTALRSTLYEVDTSDATNCNYVAVCLDPGRLGPPGGGVEYSKVQDISADTEFGRLVTYIASLNEMDEFTELNSTFRVGAHIASRIVALQTGFTASPDYSDITYMSYYEAYKAVADNLTLGETDPVAIQNALIKGIKFKKDTENWAGGNNEGKGTVYSGGPSPSHTVYSNVVNFLANYPTIDKNKGKFERDITDKWAEDGATDDTSFKVYYEATLTAPEGITIEDIEPHCSGYAGITCNVDAFNETGTLADSRKQYYLKVHFDVDSSQVSELPLTKEEKMNLSYKITYKGGMVADNIFIASPQQDAATYQRMLVFNASSPELFTYFPPIIEDCDLPGLDYKKYCNANSCDETKFNKVLFKASGCCEYVTDETSYAYVINNVCNASCTVSTMSPVCSYNATYDGSADLYEINEGYSFDGFNSNGTRKIIPKIGAGDGNDPRYACVANVTDHYGPASADDRTDGRSSKAFQKNDDNGNSRNVEYYKRNRYCQVTCKEDWQLSMDSFGNYVGKDAVAAGHYFQIDKNDLFIGGSRTCYTSYVNYIQYLNDLIALSTQSINGYNLYSQYSHLWSDLACQTGDNSANGTSVHKCGNNDDDGYEDYQVYLNSVERCNDWKDTWKCPSGYSGSPTSADGTCSKTDCTGEGSARSCTTSTTDPIFDEWVCIEKKYAWGATLNVGADAVEPLFKPFNEQEGAKDDGDYTTYKQENKEYKSMHSAEGFTTDTVTPETNTYTFSYSKESCGVSSVDVHDQYNKPNQTYTGKCFAEDTAYNNDVSSGASATGVAVNAIQEAFEYLQPDASNNLESLMNPGLSAMTSAYKEAKERIEEMFDCQHFQVYNTSDDLDAEKKNNSIMNGHYFLSTKRDYVRIDTAYDPFVSYTYDEPGYMTILNEDNILVPFDEKNDSVFKNIGKEYKESTNESVKTNIKVNGNSDIEVELSRNKLEFAYFDRTSSFSGYEARSYGKNEDGSYASDAKVGKNENSSLADSLRTTKDIVFCTVMGDPSTKHETVRTVDPAKGMVSIGVGADVTPAWNGGTCYTIKAPYLKATYISASISNSSFFKNKGYWYGKGSDVKEHGEFLRDALKNANNYRSIGYDIEKEFKSATWSPIGNFNVFPVSINTPRNLYTYTYTFAQIGSFDDGELGRIMGSDTAIISYNDRTCFYEVFEEICLCCGDEINSYVYSETTQQITKDFLNANSLPGNSSKDSISQNSGGTLSFASSSVTLTDVDSDGGIASSRPTTSNWGTQAPFTYAGEYDLTTSKGNAAKTQIEKLGETIYSRTPEYSYYLTPSTLSAIREYNSKHGYEVSYNNLRVVGGQASIAPIGNSCSNPASDTCWKADIEKMNNEVINFQHYGSTFLEEFMKPYAYDGTLADSTNEKVCLVTEAQLAADPELVSKMIDTQKCRWIDYVEDISNNDGAGLQTFSIFEGDVETEIKYFRLAFK